MESQGVRGHLQDDSHHWRADQRMAARMLALGVISEDRAKMLLVKGFELAEKTESPRGYASAMSVPLALLRIEQAELASQRPQQHEHTITIEQRRTEALGIIALLRERAGAIADSGTVNGNGKHNGNGHANGSSNGSAGS